MADERLMEVLKALGLPVARLSYEGGADTFITYRVLNGSADAFADDAGNAEGWTYRIDVYSRRDYTEILRQLRAGLREAGFYNIQTGPEMYEKDTEYYHMPVEADYMREDEE